MNFLKNFSFFSLLLAPSLALNVYWNVPTDRCQKFGINFELSKFNIIQNTNDAFDGENINIIYRPGMFPYYEDGNPIWGGIPQNGDLAAHVRRFTKQVEKEIPKTSKGYIVLDFEEYQPDYDVTPQIYKQQSIEWAKNQYPVDSETEIEKIARSTFNLFSKVYFEILLDVGRELRPNAKWGYYHYPYCSNPTPNEPSCRTSQMSANENIKWLFEKSDVLYPSIYIYKDGFDQVSRGLQVKERILNTFKLRRNEEQPIIPYFWYRYHDYEGEFIDDHDFWSSIGVMWKLQVPGFIIWGSGNYVDTEEKCSRFKNYTESRLGPMVKFVTEI